MGVSFVNRVKSPEVRRTTETDPLGRPGHPERLRSRYVSMSVCVDPERRAESSVLETLGGDPPPPDDPEPTCGWGPICCGGWGTKDLLFDGYLSPIVRLIFTE